MGKFVIEKMNKHAVRLLKIKEDEDRALIRSSGGFRGGRSPSPSRKIFRFFPAKTNEK